MIGKAHQADGTGVRDFGDGDLHAGFVWFNLLHHREAYQRAWHTRRTGCIGSGIADDAGAPLPEMDARRQHHRLACILRSDEPMAGRFRLSHRTGAGFILTGLKSDKYIAGFIMS